MNMKEFKKELEGLINKYSVENACDVPDFILAEMICNMIMTLGLSIKKTLDWHGCDSICHPKPKHRTASGYKNKQMTREEFYEHIRQNSSGQYNAMVVIGALYKKIYGEYPKIGMSCTQGEFVDELLNALPKE